MNTEYKVHTRPIHAAMGVVLGIVLLFLGLDMHFFRLIHGWKVAASSPAWLALAVPGLVLVIFAAKSFFSPRCFMLANNQGVRIFSFGTARSWNEKTRTWDVTRRKGEALLIPWNAVQGIEAGEVHCAPTIRRQAGPSVQIMGGTSRLGAKTKTATVKALQVLCDRSIPVAGFGAESLIDAWNGYSDEELQQMPEKMREELDHRELHSGFSINAAILKDSLGTAIATLEDMRQHYSTNA